MRLRTLVVAAALALGLMAAAPASASANIMWCVGDPPTTVVTPAGNHVTVNNYFFTSVRVGSWAKQGLITTWAEALPDGAGGTLVIVYAHIPAQLHTVRAVSTVQRPGDDITAQAWGSGYITLVLDVPIA